jgi:hypothetical protein
MKDETPFIDLETGYPFWLVERNQPLVQRESGGYSVV